MDCGVSGRRSARLVGRRWDPGRILIAAIVRQAVVDARSSPRAVGSGHWRSACVFVRSEAFVDFCEWLGVRPSGIREVLDEFEKERVR